MWRWQSRINPLNEDSWRESEFSASVIMRLQIGYNWPITDSNTSNWDKNALNNHMKSFVATTVLQIYTFEGTSHKVATQENFMESNVCPRMCSNDVDQWGSYLLNYIPVLIALATDLNVGLSNDFLDCCNKRCKKDLIKILFKF